MVCIACATNWSDYITVNGDVITVTVAEETCTTAENECADYYYQLAFYQNVASAMVLVASMDPENPTSTSPLDVNYKGMLSLTLVTNILNDCTKDDCPAICDDVMTVDGWIEESDGSDELLTEAFMVVEGDTYTQEQDAEELNITRRLQTTYTAELVFAAEGADTIAVGEESGVDVDISYDDDDTQDDDASLDIVDDDEEDSGNEIMRIISGLMILLYFSVVN